MKHLIIPDVHLRWEKAEALIKKVSPDVTVFLGDFFDDFGDNPQSVADGADWFHHSVNQPNRVHIAGNHDIHYWFPDNKYLRCSGYEQYKAITINDFVTKQDWEKLVFFHVIDNKWLLSHGGLAPYWLKPHGFNAMEISQYKLDTVVRRLKSNTLDAKKTFYSGGVHWFGLAGHTRSYNAPYYGGVTWLDWNGEFHPIRGIHQIVGHTPNYQLTWNVVRDGAESPEWKLSLSSVENPTLTENNSYNLCLDSQPGSRFYATYEDGKLTVNTV